MFNFNDKVILITGGSRGIGLAMSQAFSENGGKVISFGTKDNVEGNFFYKKCNIQNKEETISSVNEILEKFGKVDVLINNAGIARDTFFMRMTEEDWDQVLDTNLKGTFLITQALTRQFLKNRSGSIINITSLIGITGNIGQANYSSSKAGLIGLTRSLAQEFASRNVRVNAIAPGFIKTDMTEKLPEEVKNSYLEKIPLGFFAEPRDVANVALFLASEYARYITGEVINVNGGLYMA